MRRAWITGVMALAFACAPFVVLDSAPEARPHGKADGSTAETGTATTRDSATGNDGSDDGGSNDGGRRVEGGLVALYTFDEDGGKLIRDAITPRVDLTIATIGAVAWRRGFLSVNGDTLISSGANATKFRDRLTQSGAMSIEAWIRPKNVTQGSNPGPARIVGMGAGGQLRNFLLGQELTTLRLRVRASNASPADLNGTIFEFEVDAGPALAGLHHVVATCAAQTERRVWIDGRSVITAPYDGGFEGWENYPLSMASENDSPSGEETPRFWQGELHLVAVYDRVLPEAEIVQNFRAGPDP